MSLRDELVQVAAVALRWIETIDIAAGADPDNYQYLLREIVDEVSNEVEGAWETWPRMIDAAPGVWLAVLAEEVGEVARCLNETTIADWKNER